MQDRMERMNISIDAETREKLEELCNQKKISMSAYLRMLVNQEHDRASIRPASNRESLYSR